MFMGSRTYLGTYVFIFVIGLMFHNSLTLCGSELIEVNRVAARVNDRIVTWGEIDKAMDRLNFPENEKKKEPTSSVMEKSIVFYRYSLSAKKEWQLRTR